MPYGPHAELFDFSAFARRAFFWKLIPGIYLGIKRDHGVYFEEVIVRCGFETKNVVIVLAVNSQYARYYQELIKGSDNYRRRGYQIALKYEYLPQVDETADFIANISPNFVSVSTRNMEDQAHDDNFLEKLRQLRKRVASVDGQTILQQIDEKKSDLLARNTGFDGVEGGYYRSIAFDYLSQSKPDHYGLNASKY